MALRKFFGRDSVVRRENHTIDEKIGEGSFGIVYRGTFRGQEVAIKKTQLFRLAPEDLDREKDALLQLDHPNVIKLLHWKDVGELR
jgi:serine/threonine protein kinase